MAAFLIQLLFIFVMCCQTVIAGSLQVTRHKEDCDYSGLDVNLKMFFEERKKLNLDQCEQLCIQSPQCTHYTHSRHWGCTLKYAYTEKAAEKTYKKRAEHHCGMVKGRFNNSISITIIEKCIYEFSAAIWQTGQLAELEGHSEEQCKRACAYNKDCTYFIGVKFPGCKLFNIKTPPKHNPSQSNNDYFCGIIEKRLKPQEVLPFIKNNKDSKGATKSTACPVHTTKSPKTTPKGCF